ncbi:MAG: CoA transferase [Polyangiaceae bacterium]
MAPATARPLDGLKALELGQLLAGPFAGTLLGYWGASVIKVEPLDGDPLRSWRALEEDGTSVWWRSLSRNKRCISVDLRTVEGQQLIRRLAAQADILVENFRPATMESWGLGPEELRALNPRLIYGRVSGFGQTGPSRERPGFASVCEAAAGLRHLTGHPGQAPVRSNLSLGDTLGGLHAMMGILLALVHRERTGQGQVVDVALTESIFMVLESVLPEMDRLGVSRDPSGTSITGVVPSNAYCCSDDAWVVIGANTDGLFQRLMRALGEQEMADDRALASNPGRVANVARIDAAIGRWCAQRPADEVVQTLGAVGVPASRVNDAAAILRDPQFVHRGVMERVGETARTLPALFPKLSLTPGRTDWEGPSIGHHTEEVLRELGVPDDEIAALAARHVIRR